MADNLLNLVVKFSSLDGLSGSLKSMIGLGRTSKQAIGDLYKEASKLKSEMSGVEAEMKKSAAASMQMMDKYKALDASIANVNRRIEQQRRLMAIDGRTARIQRRADAYVSEGKAGLFSAAMTALPFFSAIKEARDYETELARIDSLGLGQGVARQADKFARSVHIIGNSTRDMAAAYGDAMAIFKDTHEADFATPLIAKMKFANQALFGSEAGGEHDSALMSLMKTIEFRGGTKNEAAFAQQADFAQKVVNASRGRVNGNEMLNAMKVGGILAKTMSDKAFYLNSEPFLQEMSGNRFGTSLSALYSNLAQGHGSIASQQELMRLGLLDPKKVEFNSLGMVKKTLPGAADISVLRDEGVLDYLNKVLLPAFAKKGITGDNAIMDEFGRIFSNGKASALMASAYQQREKLAMQGAANRRALGIEGSVKVASGTFAGKSADMSAKWSSFLEVAAKKGGLLDMAISGVGKLTDALDGLTTFGNRHPTMFKWLGTAVMWLIGLRVVTAGAKLAFGTLLGPLADLWGLWSKYKEFGTIAAMFPRATAALRGLGLIGRVLISPLTGIWSIMSRFMTLARVFSVFSRLATVFRIVRIAMAGLSLSTGGIILGLALLAYYTVTHLDEVKATFWKGIEWIKQKWKALPDWFHHLAGAIMEGLLMGLDPSRFAEHMANMAYQGKLAFKDFFGIKSPSRLMMEMGGHIATGLGLGMDNHAHKPVQSMRRMAAAVAGAGALTLAPAAGASAGASAAPRAAGKIEIHIHQQPGEDAGALAQRVMDLIERAKRGSGLATYQDDF